HGRDVAGGLAGAAVAVPPGVPDEVGDIARDRDVHRPLAGQDVDVHVELAGGEVHVGECSGVRAVAGAGGDQQLVPRLVVVHLLDPHLAVPDGPQLGGLEGPG